MGRKGFLTDEVAERIVAALKTGSYIKDAAAYGGVEDRRVYEWMQRGHRYDEHLEDGGAIIEGEDLYRRFALEADEARASARISAAGTLRKAWQDGEWRAALAYLERTDPQNWGRVHRVEMTGSEGGPVRIADVTETERRLAESLHAHVAAAQVVLEIEAVEDAGDEVEVDDYIWPIW